MAARQSKARSCSSSWSHLPPELAGLILGRFPSLADRDRFSSVCRHWRHAARQQAPVLPPPFPWTITLTLGKVQTFPDGQVHRLCSNRLAVCWCSSGSWLLMTGRESRDDKSSKIRNFLKNPLSGATLPLPDYSNPPHLGGGLYCSVTKFIICPENLVVATIGIDPLLAYCQPGTSSWSMSSLAAATAGERPEDIAFSDGSVYGITRGGDLFALQVSEDHGHRVLSSVKLLIKGGDTWRIGVRRFLVVSRGGRLLMVKWNHVHHSIRDDDDLPMFEVFEADLHMSRWSTLSGLDDQVLFVSPRCSKAVTVSPNHVGYLCGHIYFVDHVVFGHGKCCRGSTCCGMYNLRNNTYHDIVSDDAFRVYDIAAASWFFPHK